MKGRRDSCLELSFRNGPLQPRLPKVQEKRSSKQAGASWSPENPLCARTVSVIPNFCFWIDVLVWEGRQDGALRFPQLAYWHDLSGFRQRELSWPIDRVGFNSESVRWS